MNISVLTAPEAAYLLRQELGPIRAWEHCLADMRKGRTTVNGYALLPECQGKGGSAWRPMYEESKVWGFVEAVRAADPSANRNEPPQTKTAISSSTDRRHWKLRKLPVAATAFTVGLAAPAFTVGP